MASAKRRADAVWDGDLLTGTGTVNATTSGAFTSLPVSWASRTEVPDGRTSPEELVAAAHASCYCMALSAGLGRAGTPPSRIEGGWKVASSALTVKGEVADITAEAFAEAAEAAKDGCPISGALKGNVDLSVEATLA